MSEAFHDQPVVNVEGDLVALGPLRRDLLETYHRWVNDFDVARTLGLPLKPSTLESEHRRFDALTAGNSDSVVFTIYERATLCPVGITELQDIDHAHRTAELVMFIGHKECWGNGFGSEVTALMQDYAFDSLGLHNLMLKVFSHNERAIYVYEQAGFREIGRRRAAFREGGRVHDTIFMDCLASERPRE